MMCTPPARAGPPSPAGSDVALANYYQSVQQQASVNPSCHGVAAAAQRPQDVALQSVPTPSKSASRPIRGRRSPSREPSVSRKEVAPDAIQPKKLFPAHALTPARGQFIKSHLTSLKIRNRRAQSEGGRPPSRGPGATPRASRSSLGDMLASDEAAGMDAENNALAAAVPLPANHASFSGVVETHHFAA